MAQTNMTVRTEASIKAEFTDLCEKFGMSANTAMNIFMRAVLETKSIPFRIGISPKDTSKERLLQLLEENRKVRENEPELTLEEINEEINRYRKEQKTK